MRKSIAWMGSLAVLSLVAAGCTGPEQKMGRGFANLTEVVRGNEMERSIEQGGLLEGPDVGVSTGIVQGFNKTLARTGVGAYEMVTFPIPPYGPIWTNYLTPKPSYTDAYKPRKWDSPAFDADHWVGFSGGDVAPFLPWSRFRVFDN
jgi:putative exosortase-associated protein (TIGR04073 family)